MALTDIQLTELTSHRQTGRVVDVHSDINVIRTELEMGAHCEKQEEPLDGQWMMYKAGGREEMKSPFREIPTKLQTQDQAQRPSVVPG